MLYLNMYIKLGEDNILPSTEIKNNEDQDQEIEIDLKALFLKIKSLWYLLVIGLLIGAIAGVLYQGVFSTPQYESTSMVYLRSSSKSISLQDLQLSTSLTQDYEVIFTSRPNMNKVIKKLNLDYTVAQLTNMITIENPTDTRILKVTVQSTDPDEARDIANAVINYGMDNIREIDSQEPYLIEKAVSNNNRVGLGLIKITAIGALLGALLVLVGIFIRFITNDCIQSVEDVENTLQLPVLAVIAEHKALNYAKKKAHKK